MKALSHEARCDALPMRELNAHWIRIDRVHIAAKGYTALENGISAYQDELKSCSETCPASTAGWAAIVRQI